MKRSLIVLALLTPIAGITQSIPRKPTLSPENFLLNRLKPYVYLEVDHVGPGKPQREDEPKQRIWLRLHNNCIVPIIVDLFGSGAIFDDVVANLAPGSGDGGFISPQPTYPMPANVAKTLDFAEPKPPAHHPRSPSMPQGYFASVASFQTIGPGQSLSFSIPINQVSSRWHVEIPFTFDLGVHSELTGPHQFIALYEEDLPNKAAVSKPR